MAPKFVIQPISIRAGQEASHLTHLYPIDSQYSESLPPAAKLLSTETLISITISREMP